MGLAVLIASGLLVAALRGGSYAVIPRTQDAIAVWWVIGLSVAFGLLPRHRWSVEVRLAVAGLLGLAAWTALGLLWTDSTERTLEEALRVLSYAGLVMLVAWSFGARDRTRVVVLVTAVAGVVCLLALLSRVAPELLGTQSTSGSYDTTRLAYPFNYWNAVGCWGAMTLALALPLSAHARRRWLRAAALCLASLAPVVVYLTYSRTAALGVVLVVVLVVALSPQRWFVAANALIAGVGATAAVLTIRGAPEIARGSGTAGRGSVVLVLALVGLLTVAVALVGPHERLRRVRTPLRAARIALAGSLAAILVVAILAGPRAWDSFQRGSEPAGSDPVERLTSLSGTRRLLWTAALDSFTDRPLAGIGAGTFEFAWNRDPHRSGHVLDAHSLYLEALAELGIPGALMVIAALAALLTGALRSIRRQTDDTARAVAAGCVVAFVVFCVTAGVDWMWESTAVTCLALVAGTLGAALAGTAAAAPALARAGPCRDPRRRRDRRPASGARRRHRDPHEPAGGGPGTPRRRAVVGHRGRRSRALVGQRPSAARPGPRAARRAAGGGRGGRQGHAAGAGELAAVAGPRPHRGRARQRRPGAGGRPPCAGAQPPRPDLPAGRGPRPCGPLAVRSGRRRGPRRTTGPVGVSCTACSRLTTTSR